MEEHLTSSSLSNGVLFDLDLLRFGVYHIDLEQEVGLLSIS